VSGKGTYEVICEFQSGQVGVGIFKVNDHELLVLVCWQQEW
jgi:hypothetical protein